MTLPLAHGVGAGMGTPFMAFFAEGLTAAGFRVARLEFSCTAQRRHTGKQRPPDREPVLRETWLAAIEQLGDQQPDHRRQVRGRGWSASGTPFIPPGSPNSSASSTCAS